MNSKMILDFAESKGINSTNRSTISCQLLNTELMNVKDISSKEYLNLYLRYLMRLLK
jgi:hypothetical protein